jgi:signal transduction histidine kinase
LEEIMAKTLHMQDHVRELEQALDQRNAELVLFSSIQEALLSQRDMSYIFNLVGDYIHSIFDDHLIAIATFDHEAEVEHIHYHYENGKRFLSEFRSFNRISRILIESRTELLVNKNSEEFVRDLSADNQTNVPWKHIPKSFIFIPLMTDDVVRGYISMQNFEREGVFDGEHVRLLNNIARSISVTLQNDRLIKTERRKADEQKALLDTMTDLSRKLELNQLLASVLERAVSLLGVTGGELAIYHDERKELEVVASHNLGMNSGGVRLKHGEGAMGRVAETLQPLVIPDYQTWEGRSGKYTETTVRSVMVVPLLIGDQLVGALAGVHLDENRYFNDTDLNLLNMFAPLAAAAIENARLFEAERRRADEQRALLDTMTDLSRKLELNHLLASVLERAVSLLGVTGGELAIYHENSKELEVVASHNLGMSSRGVHLKHGEGAMGRVAETLEPLIIPDYQTWEYRSDKYTETIVRSVMVVPLLIGNQLVGALASVHLDEGRIFDNNDLKLLNMFAPLAATAIENARLFNKTTRLLEEAEQRATELKRTQDQLVQQEKLASLGQLTAGIAHEIKNPLNFVTNFSDVSLELIDEALEELQLIEQNEHSVGTASILADVKSNLRKIHEHGTRADGIVKSMLQHSRGGSGTLEPTDLNALIKEYVNLSFHGMRAGKAPINVDIDLQLDDQVGQVPLVIEDFSRVILNLCNNAFDAMREQLQRSEVGSQRSAVYLPKLTVRTRNGENRITIEIEDNGPGIPEEILDKILQPFFTTKKGTQGTGLGLSITHDIVKAHGGELKIDSTEGRGTIFSIILLQR